MAAVADADAGAVAVESVAVILLVASNELLSAAFATDLRLVCLVVAHLDSAVVSCRA